MKSYLDLLQKVRHEGITKSDRTGTGTRSLFGYQLRFNLREGLPLLTTKRVHLKSVIYELLWFLRGDTNVAYLNEHGVHIWDEWADEEGSLGHIYGHQWRSWPSATGEGIDQISNVVSRIKSNPDCRRLVVTAWNPSDIPQMALPPCHCMFQFNVANGRLSCQVYQRSADIFLGLPFNIASYSLLVMMVAQVTGYDPGDLVYTLGDVHLYLNHLDQADLQLARSTRSLPTMVLDPNIKSIFDFQYGSFQLINYNPHRGIRAPVSV